MTNHALLTFSYDTQNALPEVGSEMIAINNIFMVNGGAPLTGWSVDQAYIENAFIAYKSYIRIFHFSGHAGPSLLQTSFMGKPRYTFAEGLSKNIGLFGKGLKLVFLNGCSTQDQANFFLQNGVPAVIASRKPVQDRYACEFARRFYENFINGKLTLYESFESAKNSFDAANGNFYQKGNNLVDPKFLDDRFRSIFHLAPDDTPEIFRLFPAGTDVSVLQEKFTDWFSPASNNLTTPKENDPAKLISHKKEEYGYLQCDRDQSSADFHRIILEKINGQRPEPHFFFIYEAEQHCPQLLPMRFERYSLRELYKSGQSPLNPDKSSNYFKELDLPTPDRFQIDASGIGFTDSFKKELSDIYQRRFGGTPSSDNHLAQINSFNEPLLVVQHRLDHSHWRGEERREKLEALLEFYAEPYSIDLQTQLSERLLVIFHLQLIREDLLLKDGLFLKLANKAQWKDRFTMVTRLPEIDWGHIQCWERKFLGVLDNTFIDINKFFTITDEQSGQPEEEPRDSLPYKRVIDRLQAEIRRYNKRLAHVA